MPKSHGSFTVVYRFTQCRRKLSIENVIPSYCKNFHLKLSLPQMFLYNKAFSKRESNIENNIFKLKQSNIKQSSLLTRYELSILRTIKT